MTGLNIRFYEFGEFILDSRRRILLKNGDPVPLTSRIFDLLLIFVQNEGQVLEHEDLLDKVWGGAFVEQSNLKKSVSALRQVLGESPNDSIFIKTIPRRGYSFVAPVRAIPEKEETPPENTAVLRESPVVVQETDSDIPVQKISSKTGRPLIIAAVSLLFLALVAFGVWQFSRRSVSGGGFRIENLKIQKLTGSGNIEEAVLSPDGKTYVYVTSGEGGKQALMTKRIGSPNPLALIPPTDARYMSLAVSPDNNSVYYAAIAGGTEILYRIPILGGEPRKITENLSSPATFSSDGKKLAFVRDLTNGRRVLITLNAEDGSDEKEIYSVTDNHKLILPQWAPGDKSFAFINSESTSEGRIWAISEIPAIPAGGGEPKVILTPQRGKVYYFEWLRDGSGLIVCTEPNDLTQSQLWHVAYPGGQMTRLTNDIATYQNISVSADGNTMLAVQREKTGDLWAMNWSLLQNSSRVTDSQNFIGHFAVLPDEKIVAEAVENGQRGLTLLNADGTNPQPLFTKSNVERAPDVSPDGKDLYFISVRSGTQELWRSDPDGRNPQKLTDLKTFLHTIRKSPDGKSIFFELYDGVRWRLAKIPLGGGEHTIVIEETIGEYSFSPDGSLLAYSYFDDGKKRWQAALRRMSDLTVQKQFDIAPSSMLIWTRDGKALLYTVSENLREGGSLWMQPVDGSTPKPVLETKDDNVMWADWSRDGSKLYFTRGKITSNIVLITKDTEGALRGAEK